MKAQATKYWLASGAEQFLLCAATALVFNQVAFTHGCNSTSIESQEKFAKTMKKGVVLIPISF